MIDFAKHCPTCGATLGDADTCEDLFSRTQAKEFSDTDYWPVHHLSVPCYKIQHNGYSREGFWLVRALLERFTQGLDPQEFLSGERHGLGSRTRNFSLVKGEKLTELDDVKWSFLVSDVRLDTAEHYCRDVRQWAEAVLRDTAHLRQQ